MNCELYHSVNAHFDMIPPHICSMCIKTKQESAGSKNTSHNIAYLYEACDQISDFCHQ